MTTPAGWKAPIETTALGTERIVWHNELTKGIFHKHVVDTQRITNYRVIHNNSQILLKDVDDILVMNQHRISQSSYMGTSTGRYARFGHGSSRSEGTSVGDLVFMYQGRPYIIFKQITDPNGVARLAKSTRKQLLTAIKAAEKFSTYKSPSYKIKIDYPVNWTKVEQGLGKPLVVAFTSPKEDVYDRFLESVAIRIVQVSKQITLDQFVQLSVNDLKNKNPDLKILESASTRLSGMPAHRTIYNKQGRTHLNLAIIKLNTVYMIIYVAETSKYPIYLPTAQKIINSFEFID
jgi:PsbP-like protein